jgi:hypothetical protein
MRSKTVFAFALVAIGTSLIGPVTSANAANDIGNKYRACRGASQHCLKAVDPNRQPRRRPVVANPGGGGNVISGGVSPRHVYTPPTYSNVSHHGRR